MSPWGQQHVHQAVFVNFCLKSIADWVTRCTDAPKPHAVCDICPPDVLQAAATPVPLYISYMHKLYCYVRSRFEYGM